MSTTELELTMRALAEAKEREEAVNELVEAAEALAEAVSDLDAAPLGITKPETVRERGWLDRIDRALRPFRQARELPKSFYNRVEKTGPEQVHNVGHEHPVTDETNQP